jgi:hypothetical protein
MPGFSTAHIETRAIMPSHPGPARAGDPHVAIGVVDASADDMANAIVRTGSFEEMSPATRAVVAVLV